MASQNERAAAWHARGAPWYATLFAVFLGIAGLPAAVWLDLTALSDKAIGTQAAEISRIIDSMRGLYATNVVGRVLDAKGPVTATHRYSEINGGIPIPATMSIELANKIGADQGEVGYRFVSDLPFRGREPHALDEFETKALATLRADPKAQVAEVTGSLFDRKLRLVTPVVLGPVCVACHNSHPDSPKTDWKEGDVRGIQEVIVAQPIDANIFAFKYLLAYIAFATAAGAGFIVMQRRQSMLIGGMNKELSDANDFLAAISIKIAKYIPPQIYKSIFSGQHEGALSTERRKLTVFYSDIRDFGAAADRLPPEDLTALLNEYLTAMAMVAQEYGGTLDKFVGDAVLVFFGAPETRGPAEDAKACVRMALAMKNRLHQLTLEWRRRGIQGTLEARMGVNSGYCNIGAFGSEDRMEYTVVGAEANLAARLQALAHAGEIVLSGDTYALVRGEFRAQPRKMVKMQGIGREIVPHVLEGLAGEAAERPQVISEHGEGIDLFIDLEALDEKSMKDARRRLAAALKALDREIPSSR